MNPPCSSVHGISQARILGWVAIFFFRGSFQPRDWTQVSCTLQTLYWLNHQGRLGYYRVGILPDTRSGNCICRLMATVAMRLGQFQRFLSSNLSTRLHRNGNPLQYFCLGNPMNRGAWRATVQGVANELDMTEWLNNNHLPTRCSPELIGGGLGSQLRLFCGPSRSQQRFF